MECKHCKDFVVNGVCDDCHEKERMEVLRKSDKMMKDRVVELQVAYAELAFVWNKLKEMSPEAYARLNEEVKSIREQERNRAIEPAPKDDDDGC